MLTRTELAQLLHFAVDLLKGAPTESPETASDPNGGGPAPTKRRGRPAGSTAAAAVTVEPTPPGNTAQQPDNSTTIAPTVKGKTLEELKALIQPLIKAARGVEVKKVINDHAPEGHSGDYTLSALSEHPEKHDSFVSAIEMLSM